MIAISSMATIVWRRQSRTNMTKSLLKMNRHTSSTSRKLFLRRRERRRRRRRCWGTNCPKRDATCTWRTFQRDSPMTTWECCSRNSERLRVWKSYLKRKRHCMPLYASRPQIALWEQRKPFIIGHLKENNFTWTTTKSENSDSNTTKSWRTNPTSITIWKKFHQPAPTSRICKNQRYKS